FAVGRCGRRPTTIAQEPLGRTTHRFGRPYVSYATKPETSPRRRALAGRTPLVGRHRAVIGLRRRPIDEWSCGGAARSVTAPQENMLGKPGTSSAWRPAVDQAT